MSNAFSSYHPSTALLTKASPHALSLLGPGGPFADMPEQLAHQVLSVSELIGEKAGVVLVSQNHRAEFFHLLLQGEVSFRMSVEATGQDLDVGSSSLAWTPVGWSGFRAPHRYATTVTTSRYSELLRFRTRELTELFDREPEAGRYFFTSLSKGAARLLIDVRERLLSSLRKETSVSHWSQDNAERRSLTIPPRRRTTTEYRYAPLLSRQEAMVTNAAPDVSELLRRSPFFEDFPEGELSRIREVATVSYFCRGDLLQEQGKSADDFLVLADGRVRMEYTSSSGRSAVLRTLNKPGQILGWCAAGASDLHDVSIRGTKDGSVLGVPASALMQLFRGTPELGCRFGAKTLWLISRQLRAARAHLVSESFDREVLAVENLIEQARTELSVTSPLHKLPHLLKSAVTLGDALAVVEEMRRSGNGLEAHVADVCHELLTPVRREHRFFVSLQQVYEEVATAPASMPPDLLRKRNAQSFVRMFSQIPSRIEGLDNLPRESGHIFVFNHLRNHDYNTLPNGFQLTLDSHFLSAMILYRHYGDPGVRVVRCSRAGEYGHQAYYDRLGHVPVYTRESDTPQKCRSERMQEFLETAAAHLRKRTNLVLAPEGSSYSTEESPGPFRAGAFRLAASLDPEPWIVPVAVANFDRRLDHTTLAVIVKEPFRMSERIRDVDDPAELRNFLEEFRLEYAGWVREARELAG